MTVKSRLTYNLKKNRTLKKTYSKKFHLTFNKNNFSDMIPISSTVIPLPVYKVAYGFNFISKDKKSEASFKPEDEGKLITGNEVAKNEDCFLILLLLLRI